MGRAIVHFFLPPALLINNSACTAELQQPSGEISFLAVVQLPDSPFARLFLYFRKFKVIMVLWAQYSDHWNPFN